VRDVAHKAGYRRRVARRKPFTSHRTALQRLHWALRNRRTDWSGFAWTDEANIE
ncbi:hypothetical protein BDV93DRAFT_396950, partial [Ceratobasidium sp. AG-I]